MTTPIDRFVVQNHESHSGRPWSFRFTAEQWGDHFHVFVEEEESGDHYAASLDLTYEQVREFIEWVAPLVFGGQEERANDAKHRSSA